MRKHRTQNIVRIFVHKFGTSTMAWRSYISISEAMKKSFQMQSIHAFKCAEENLHTFRCLNIFGIICLCPI